MYYRNDLILRGNPNSIDQFVRAAERETGRDRDSLLSYVGVLPYFEGNYARGEIREYCHGFAHYHYTTHCDTTAEFAFQASQRYPSLVFECLVFGDEDEDWFEQHLFRDGVQMYYRQSLAYHYPVSFSNAAQDNYRAMRQDLEREPVAIEPEDTEDRYGCWDSCESLGLFVMGERADKRAQGLSNWRDWKRWGNNLTITGSVADIASLQCQIVEGRYDLQSHDPLRPIWEEEFDYPDSEERSVNYEQLGWARYVWHSNAPIPTSILEEMSNTFRSVTIDLISSEYDDGLEVGVRQSGPRKVFQGGVIWTPCEENHPKATRMDPEPRWQDSGF
jgi:hypothetical protein